MGYQNCFLRVQRHFLRSFFHRIILIGTVSEKIQLVLSKLHSILRGTFEQNNSRSRRFGFFLVLARFFKHGLPQLYSTCPETLFAEFFSQNHINWHGERKNSAGFVKTAFYFSGQLLSKTILKVVDLVFFSSTCQILQAWVAKAVFKGPEALFVEFSTQNYINWHCERKTSAGFVKIAFYFSGEFLGKTILEVVDLVFLLVLARFFKHGLPKLYSTCPETLF